MERVLRGTATCVKRRRVGGTMVDFSYLSVALPSTTSAPWRYYVPCRERCILAPFGCIQQRLAGCMIVGKLCPIPSLKFFPFGWIVVEPATQIAARRYVPAPSVHLHRLLVHPSWPQTLYQESRAIFFCWRVIHSFDLDHRHMHLRRWGYLFF